MTYMKNLVSRVFQYMEIVGVKNWKIFSVWCLCIIWLLITCVLPINVFDVYSNMSVNSDSSKEYTDIKM